MVYSADSQEAQPDPWFVVWTESRAEKKVAARIAASGFSTWLPLRKERHRWSDRWRDVLCPVFPGYLFARSADAQWNEVLRIPGVLTVVKRGEGPALLADQFVTNLREAIERGTDLVEPLPSSFRYAPGDEVVVQDGPLAGIRGAVVEHRSGRQLVVWVSEIGRGIAVTIGSALVKPAS